KFPIKSLFLSLFKKKQFKRTIDLRFDIKRLKTDISLSEETIDVIIPTLKRPEFVKQVLKDLKAQTYQHTRVIIIEQDPEENSISKLGSIHNKNWPFEIVHQFIHNTGACKARNIALQEVTSKWIFFADDDIRLSPEILHKA